MQFKSDRLYDIVLVNDLLYSKHVDFYAVMEKVRGAFGAIRPHLLRHPRCARAAHLGLFDKDRRFRRYDLEAVRRHLASHGLTIEAEVPSMGIKGGLDEAARRMLWAVAASPTT
ncbi:MAG: hypothetical protein WDN31_01840 [Hyphomicrobium sp.]